MVPPSVLPLLLHEIFPGGDVMLAILIVLGGMGIVAYVLWGYIEARFGAKGLIRAVLAGSVLVSVISAIWSGEIREVRETVFMAFGALGGSAWASHASLERRKAGGSFGWLGGAAGFVGGLIVGVMMTEWFVR